MPKSDVVPRWFTKRDAAAYISVSEQTINRLISAGSVPYVTVGRKSVRIAISALDAYMRRTCIQSIDANHPDQTEVA